MLFLLALSDLVTPLTPKQCEDTILATATTIGFTVTSWKPGGIARTIVKIFAIIYSALTQMVALVAGGGFLDSAVGVWLTILAYNVYNVRRIEATFATGAQAVELTNSLGGHYDIEPGQLTFSATIAGVKKLYRNTSSGTLAPGPGTTLLLDVRAVEVGTASNANPGDITTLEEGFLGVSCTNILPVLGQDQERDADLRERCRDSLGALSPNGPRAAYRFAAKSAVRLADGSAIGITRVKIPTPPGDGSLTVIVATRTGAVPGTVGDTSTDLGVVDSDIQNNVVPQGVGPVAVVSATEVALGITADIYVDEEAELDDAAIATLANTAISLYFETIPIGGFILGVGDVFKKALEGVIRGSSPFFIKVDVTVPANDVALGEDEVPVFDGPAVLTNHQVQAAS